MLLRNTKEASQFLPSLNLTMENDRLNDFFIRAQKWLVDRVLGEFLETELEQSAPPLPVEPEEPEEPEITAEEDVVEPGEVAAEEEVPGDDPHAKLRLLCQRVIAERALLDAIPEMDMQLTEAGFAVQNNDNFSPASAQRVDRLLNSLPDRIADDVDSVVHYLLDNSTGTEQNPCLYDNWRGTEQFKYLSAAFMPLREQYHRYGTQRAENYDDFYNAIPVMAEAMNQTVAYFVSDEEIEQLLELYRDNQLLLIHAKAIMQLRFVASAAYEGSPVSARNHAINARNVMLSAPDSFPAFKNSPAFKQKDVNIDGGKIVNFL